MRSFLAPRPHDLVWATGGDAVTFLDGLLSQSIDPMAPGTVARSLLLTPRGKLTAPLWLLRGDDRVGLAVEHGHGPVVAEELGRFRLRVDVDLAGDERSLAEVWGPAGRELVPSGSWLPGPPFAADLPMINSTVPRVLTDGPVDAVEAGEEEAEWERIAAGEPRLGVDVDERTIPQEAALVDGAVDFAKGCYLGQELVARIDSRGRVNRRLRGLRLQRPVDRGVAVVAGDTEVGTVTSTASSPHGGAIGLAMVRREVEVGDLVQVDGTSAEVTVLPIPDR